MLATIKLNEQACFLAEEEIVGGVFHRCFELPYVFASDRLLALNLTVRVELTQFEVPVDVCAATYISEVSA